MTIQRVLFLILYVVYTTSSQTIYIYIRQRQPQISSRFFDETTNKTYVTEALFFEPDPPKYLNTDYPSSYRPQNQHSAQPPPQQAFYSQSTQSIAQPQNQAVYPQSTQTIKQPQNQANYGQSMQSIKRPQNQSPTQPSSPLYYPQSSQSIEWPQNQRPVQSSPPPPPQQSIYPQSPESFERPQNNRPVQQPIYPQSPPTTTRSQNTNDGFRPGLPINNPPNVNRPTNVQNSTTSAISDGIYNLGQQILFQAIGSHGRQNFKSEVISPLSIAGVSYLLYLGAAGQTENELATLLGLNRGTNQKEVHQQFGQLLNEIVHDREIPNSKKEYPEETENRVHEISVANALFVNNNIALRRQYENVARNTYQSEVRQMNFGGQGRESKRYIDNWVSNKTRGKIPTILAEPPTGNTQMIVVSALYFKALWWEELGVLHVNPLPFYPDGERNAPISVDTILFTSEFLPHYQSTELNCRIIGLKYQKQLSTMYIIQPLQSNRQTLRNLQTQLTAERLNDLISHMTPIYVSTLSVPKFHLQNEVDLKSIFQQMGVTSLFSNANLTPITPSQTEYPNQPSASADDLEYLDVVRRSSRDGSGVSISQIHHKVDLVVNEKGTEGGAATAAYADKIFGNTIKINTPFLFVVRQDNTRFPLFYGAVFEPEQD